MVTMKLLWKKWCLFPFTVSDDLEDDRIHFVAFDFTTGYLWCATDADLSCRVVSSEEWWNISYRSLGFDDGYLISSTILD